MLCVFALFLQLLQESAGAAAGAQGRKGESTEEDEHEGAEAPAPALLWLDIPFSCTDHNTPSLAAVGEGAGRHFTSLGQVDGTFACARACVCARAL